MAHTGSLVELKEDLQSKEVSRQVPNKGAIPASKKEICPLCKQMVPGSLPGRAKSHCTISGERDSQFFLSIFSSQVKYRAKLSKNFKDLR